MSNKSIGIVVPSVGGALIAIGIGLVTIPSVAIFAGAGVAFWLTRRYETQKYYAVIGTFLYILLGVLVLIMPFVSGKFKQSPAIFLLVFGTISAIIVIIRRFVSFVLSIIADYRGKGRDQSFFWNVISSILGTIFLAWILVKMKYRLAKTGIAGTLTPVGLGLNIMGHFFELPWILEVGLNLTTVVFIGGVLVIFHVLTSWYELIAARQSPLVQAFAERSKSAGARATNESMNLADSAADKANTASLDDIPGGQIMSRILNI